MKNLIHIWERIFTVPDTFEPDDLRRRQIMNTILVFVIIVVALQLIVIVGKSDLLLELQGKGRNGTFLVVGTIGMGIMAIFLIWVRSGRLSRNLIGWIFIVSVIGLASISDLPRHLTVGRSIFVWALPVTLSVIVLPPAAVFVVDLLITILFAFFSGFQWANFATYTLMEIYIVSLISWLGMSIANRAIRDARNEARKNAAILEGVAEGVIVVGPNKHVVLANPAASELMGRDMVKIVPLTESAEIRGRALSLRWSKVEGVGWVAIVRDVTRQRESDRAKDAMLRVVSHEMRTPLAAILGFAEILERRPVPEMAARIRANAQRMLKLVNELLDVAQFQAGALTIHQGNFPPTLLSCFVQENFLKPAGEKGITLEVQASPSLPEQVVGDVQRLEQVISNLVENALKFTDSGGKVMVSFDAKNDQEWQIVVNDSGIGIPPERLSDIFEPFRRASDYATRKHQGIGLGLSIVKRIVQLSGGSIAVESAVGAGTTFTVTLPVA